MKKILLFLFILTLPPLFCDEKPTNHLQQLEKEEPAKDSKFYETFIKMLYSLALLIGALFLVLLIFKRFLLKQTQKVNEQSQIKIIEQRALSPKTSLFLLELGGQRILISESHSGITFLAKAPHFTVDQIEEEN
jgi:flagellar biogenesis protein FliO